MSNDSISTCTPRMIVCSVDLVTNSKCVAYLTYYVNTLDSKFVHTFRGAIYIQLFKRTLLLKMFIFLLYLFWHQSPKGGDYKCNQPQVRVLVI
jgi:hypothetical protein